MRPKHLYCLRARRSLELYGYLQKRISVMRVGVYTSDSNNWMPRVYARGYVCAIIGFGRDRVTIVIKSYGADATWRCGGLLLLLAAPLYRGVHILLRTTCIFV